MADISIIHHGSTDYYVKDTTGREALAVVENKGAKNLLKLWFEKKTAGDQTAEMTADGYGIVINGDRSAQTDTILVYDIVTNESSGLDTRYTLPAGWYVLTKTNSSTLRLQVYAHDGTSSISLGYSHTTDFGFEYSAETKAQYPYLTFRVWASRTSSFSNYTVYPMLCTLEEWRISQEYRHYGMDNPELTSIALPSRDAIKAMDKTYSKNIADMSKVPVKVRSSEGVVVTITDDGTILASGTSSSNNNIFFNVFFNDVNTVMIPPGTWVAKLYGTGSENFRIEGSDSVHPSVYKGTFGNPFIFTVPEGVTSSLVRICAKPNTDFTGTSMKLMICSKGEWDNSQDYVPYGMTNLDLTTFTRAVANRGSKNVGEITAVSSSAGGVDYTVNPDGTVIANRTASSTTSTWFRLNSSLSLKAGTYVLSGGYSTNRRLLISPTATLADAIADSQGNEVTFTLTQDTDNLIYAIRIAYTDSPSNVKFYPMIRPVEILDSTYQPFARTNRELTVLTDEDRASLVELVDSGYKNEIALGSYTITPRSLTVTADPTDGSITIDGTSSNTDSAVLIWNLKTGGTSSSSVPNEKQLKNGKYVIKAIDSQSRISLRVQGFSSTPATSTEIGSASNTDTEIVVDNTYTYNMIRINIGAQKTFNNEKFYPMVCTKASYGISKTFQPYRQSWQEMYEEKIGIEDAFGAGIKILTNGTADITEIGNFYCQDAATAATITNAPWTDSGFFGFIRRSVLPSERLIQIAFKNNDTMSIAKRRYTGTWQPWAYSSSEPRSVGDYIMSYADSLPSPGVYFAYHIAGSGIDKPVSGHRFMYQIMMMSSSYGCIHAYEIDPSSGSAMYIANKINGTWGSWYKFEGTSMT